MAPRGLAILIGAGPNTGTGIARILATEGNLAVALLARSDESLKAVRDNVLRSSPQSIIETFSSDTDPKNLSSAFSKIKGHPSFKGLKLDTAIFSIKHSTKKPFLEETHEEFTGSLTTYVGGAMAFAQESVKRFYADHGDDDLSGTGGAKKGTLIFTGTLGALRANSEYGAYGAGRSGVRQLAQSLAREYSVKGIHVVHTIANGSIRDENGADQRVGKKMSAESVGRTYLWLSQQGVDLWTHELDMRPAQERF